MTKKDLAPGAAFAAGITKEQAATAITTAFNTIQGILLLGEKVRIAGFGTFELKKRAARQGRNPANGALMVIPEKETITFKMAKSFETSINAK